MPELPEVETVARGLKPLEGKKLLRLKLQDPKVWFESQLEPKQFSQKTLVQVSRRGKYLILQFEGDLFLLVHLRMTGKILPLHSVAVPEKIRLEATTTKQLRLAMQFVGEDWYFYDTRRFGTYTAIGSKSALEKFWRKKKLAPDPFIEEVEAMARFREKIMASPKPMKNFLLDQSAFAGAGNIYADEVLYRVKISPKRPARKAAAEAQVIFQNLKEILAAAIEAKGTSILNYVGSNGESGDFAPNLRVYGRTGEPCGRCKTKIRRILMGGRATHFCPKCQAR